MQMSVFRSFGHIPSQNRLQFGEFKRIAYKVTITLTLDVEMYNYCRVFWCLVWFVAQNDWTNEIADPLARLHNATVGLA